jgi:carboxypeptidase Taq
MAGLEEFRERVNELSDIGSAIAVLGWDQETMMPPKAGESRAYQLATLEGIYHEHLTSADMGDALTALSDTVAALDDQNRALVREVRCNYERAVKIPTKLVKDLAEATSRGVEVWKRARAESDFHSFLPALRTIIDLKKQVAECVGYQQSPYDALLDKYEPGQTQAATEPVFAALRAHTVALLDAVRSSRRSTDRSILRRSFDTRKQMEFTVDVLNAMGFDFQAGRQDVSTHPFTTSFASSDVRITTRVDEHDGASCLMGSIHEGGHALYEQGVSPGLARTPLSDGASLGIHESQSRLWENFVGRSKPFWEYHFPRLQARFPESLSDVPLEAFLASLNVVDPSFIRVEADEVTYNLHIILRFEIESALFSGNVNPVDLPDVWNTKMKDYLGVTPPNDTAGILQDIHWSIGSFGYFPTYSLGNLYAAQLYATIRNRFPDFDDRLRNGDLMFLRVWLRENIHHYGRIYPASELIVRVTGEPLNPDYLATYLRRKYLGEA